MRRGNGKYLAILAIWVAIVVNLLMACGASAEPNPPTVPTLPPTSYWNLDDGTLHRYVDREYNVVCYVQRYGGFFCVRLDELGR
jgi:hypothetical protein